MRTEFGKIEGDVVLDHQLVLCGLVTGSLTIVSGGELQLNGTCAGNVIVEVGGEATVRGTVGGNVTNRGGFLSIFGVVNGDLIRFAGETTLDAKAIIRGTTHGAP